MLAYILAIAVGLGSLALYIAAFFFPEIHRKDDFLWSGVGLFYALVLWVCAGRITGGVLLGQAAAVFLLGWFTWQSMIFRQAIAHPEAKTEILNFSLIDWLTSKVTGIFTRSPKPTTEIPVPQTQKEETATTTPVAEKEIPQETVVNAVENLATAAEFNWQDQEAITATPAETPIGEEITDTETTVKPERLAEGEELDEKDAETDEITEEEKSADETITKEKKGSFLGNIFGKVTSPFRKTKSDDESAEVPAAIPQEKDEITTSELPEVEVDDQSAVAASANNLDREETENELIAEISLEEEETEITLPTELEATAATESIDEISLEEKETEITLPTELEATGTTETIDELSLEEKETEIPDPFDLDTSEEIDRLILEEEETEITLPAELEATATTGTIDELSLEEKGSEIPDPFDLDTSEEIDRLSFEEEKTNTPEIELDSEFFMESTYDDKPVDVDSLFLEEIDSNVTESVAGTSATEKTDPKNKEEDELKDIFDETTIGERERENK